MNADHIFAFVLAINVKKKKKIGIFHIFGIFNVTKKSENAIKSNKKLKKAIKS
jgi:hypothetical protein